MADLSRRGFLTRTSLTLGAVGVGLASGLGARQWLATAPTWPNALPSSISLPALPQVGGPALETMIVHIRDISTAEVALMVGTREVVFTDPQLVKRLVQAAGREG